MDLAQRYKISRQKAGLSQAAVGDALGCGREAISKIENGRTRVPKDIKGHCDILNITPEYLIMGTEESEEFRDISFKLKQLDAAGKLNGINLNLINMSISSAMEQLNA